jgi:hypothetical protein
MPLHTMQCLQPRGFKLDGAQAMLLVRRLVGVRKSTRGVRIAYRWSSSAWNGLLGRRMARSPPDKPRKKGSEGRTNQNCTAEALKRQCAGSVHVV